MGDGGILIFYCGSQYADWVARNCDNCHRRDGKCDLRAALVGDGGVVDDVARRLGYTGHEMNYGWRCGELDPREPEEVYFRRFIPRVTKLARFPIRLLRAVKLAAGLWSPWPHLYGALPISLRTAWTVAWGIHHEGGR